MEASCDAKLFCYLCKMRDNQFWKWILELRVCIGTIEADIFAGAVIFIVVSELLPFEKSDGHFDYGHG